MFVRLSTRPTEVARDTRFLILLVYYDKVTRYLVSTFLTSWVCIITTSGSIVSSSLAGPGICIGQQNNANNLPSLSRSLIPRTGGSLLAL
jgi:hypothetical protein